MTDLERRALLGDVEAQRDCTEKGIVLPCPCCGCAAALHTTDMFSTIYAVCQKCGLRTSGYHSPDTAIKFWNTRPAPPIGRCKDCLYLKPWGECNNTGEQKSPDGFCDAFSQKGGEEK